MLLLERRQGEMFLGHPLLSQLGIISGEPGVGRRVRAVRADTNQVYASLRFP